MTGSDQSRQQRRAAERAAAKQQASAARIAATPWRPLRPAKVPHTWHARAAMAAINAGVGTGAPVPALFDVGRAAMACVKIFKNQTYRVTIMPATDGSDGADLLIVRADGLPAGEWKADIARIEQDVMGGTGAAYREVGASEAGLARGPHTLHLRYASRDSQS